EDEEFDDEADDESEADEGFDAEVENRLAIANCFRALLETELFETSGKTTRYVEKKVRKFVKSELEILLRMKQPEPKQVIQKVEPQFSEAEATALKYLASKV